MRYLLVIDDDGNVVLADSDSDAGVRIPIGEPLAESQQSRVTGAAWSAAGDWTAWSIDSESPNGVHEVRLHEEETDRSSVLAEGVSAFYLCPSPCGRWLSHLSPGPLGLELALSEVLTGDLQIVERGQPMFWSWSPDSSYLAIHVEDRVIVSALDGSPPRVISDHAGPFIAPWWLPGGSVAFTTDDRIVAVSVQADDQDQAAKDPVTVLINDSTTGRFSPDPEGRRIAHIEQVDGHHRLVVVDLLSGTVDEVTTEPVGGFFWSSDGSRLATLVSAADGHVHWLVFDGSEVAALPPFRPSRSWIGAVLPFFEQYAQSHSHWSGDASRLVAPAVDDSGNGGALIQSVESPNETRWIPDAELVWWA